MKKGRKGKLREEQSRNKKKDDSKVENGIQRMLNMKKFGDGIEDNYEEDDEFFEEALSDLEDIDDAYLELIKRTVKINIHK